MKLTSFTDYGLRALMRMAADPDRTFTTEELARTFAISAHHLTKIAAALGRAGIITAQRGAGGGLRLARPADEITIGRIVRVLEEGSALVECFRADGGDCVMTSHCVLKGRLRLAEEAFLHELDRTSLAACAWPATPQRGAA